VFLIHTSRCEALIDLEEGDIPKGFTLESLDGREISLSYYMYGRPVIIVFWKIMEDKSFLDYSLDELRFLNKHYSTLQW